MTLPYGLGAIESPPDARDYPLELDQATPLPASFTVAHLSPIYNQHQTPMCVAYSAAGEQQSFDLADQGHTYAWDFAYFFRRIGGGPNGAIIRNALDERLHRGYPLLPSNSGNSQAAHRIAAYYAVSKTQDSLKRALVQYGTLVLGTPWFNSWFDPNPDGTLPSADYIVGGHAIDVTGYDAQGLWLSNSWGPGWAVKGRCRMPWYAVLHSVREVWKAVDVIDPKGA